MVNIVNPSDIVCFCSLRNNPEAADRIVRESHGLSDLETIERNLASGDYTSVLKAVWSERDRSKRLTWLRDHFRLLHAPLMYELAIAEFVAQPSVETINKISIPLMKVASFRIAQDASCVNDSSAQAGVSAMEYVYTTALRTQVEKKLPNISLEHIFEQNRDERLACIKAKVREVAEMSKHTHLPDPTWIAFHGMKVIITGHVEMAPQERWHELTDQVANKILG
jgi:hypothetical protein